MKWRVPDLPQHKGRNPITLRYFNSYLKKAVSMAQLYAGDIVLDYGCDKQQLKPFVGDSIMYTGYDINPELTDVKFPEDSKANKVIALHILEHLTDKQLQDFIKKMKKMKIDKLVVGLPLENILTTTIKSIDKSFFKTQITHFSTWKPVCNELYKHFTCTSVHTIWFMTLLTTWELKK